MRKRNTLCLSLLVAAALTMCAGTLNAHAKHAGKLAKRSARRGTAKTRVVGARTTTPSSQSAASKRSVGKSASSMPKSPSSSKSKPHSSARSHRGRYSRSRRRDRGQKAPTSDRISEIQTALAKDGSFASTPNGKWDDSTVQAMKKFQAAHSLNPTGKLDALTLEKLGLGSQTAGVAAPAPAMNSSSVSSTPAQSARPE